MKRIIILLLTLVLLFSFNSCITVDKTASLHRDREEIQSVSIYYLEEIYDESNVNKLRNENTPVYTLKEEQKEEFINRLCEFKYEKTVILVPIPFDGGCNLNGYVISVAYNDGKSYELFSEYGCFSYLVKENGKEGYYYNHADYSGEADWAEFIESYINN